MFFLVYKHMYTGNTIQDHYSLNPIPARLPELRQGPGGADLPYPLQTAQNQCETQIFFFALLESLGKFRNCHQALLKKIIVSLANIYLFRFGKADLPPPGRNRVKLTIQKIRRKKNRS